jgi:hypothetical protein
MLPEARFSTITFWQALRQAIGEDARRHIRCRATREAHHDLQRLSRPRCGGRELMAGARGAALEVAAAADAGNGSTAAWLGARIAAAANRKRLRTSRSARGTPRGRKQNNMACRTPCRWHAEESGRWYLRGWAAPAHELALSKAWIPASRCCGTTVPSGKEIE